MSEYLSKKISIPLPEGEDSLNLTLRTSIHDPNSLSVLEPKASYGKPKSIIDFESKKKLESEFYYWTADFYSHPKDSRYKHGSANLDPSDFWNFYQGLLTAKESLDKLKSVNLTSDYSKMLDDIFNPSIFIEYSDRFIGVNILLSSEGKKTYHINYDEKVIEELIESLRPVFIQGEQLVKEMELISPLKISTKSHSSSNTKNVSIFEKIFSYFQSRIKN
ncbi:hypothetical protein [Pseudoalteromonas sp.]|uniref:hypothetical protein n=1 Tax=Pseudoalteromonas sp. TaxID=53249 RepID=UPI00235496A2|nr:hypothetical protein [Pseudoalteromonas sp.]